jgi:TIR domain
MTESTPAPPRIFISYRRKDGAHAGRLSDRLSEHFGRAQIFQDIDSIPPGADFAEEIADAVASCQVLLALIGDGWLKIKDEEGRRRLDNPEDYVRLEIEAALSRNIRVIPILIDGAKMPRASQLPSSLAGLARYQALELSPDRDRYDFDVGRLLKALDKPVKKMQKARPLPPMQGQPLSTPPASAKPVPLTPDLIMPTPDETRPTNDEVMASLSPDERASLEKIKDPLQRAVRLLMLGDQVMREGRLRTKTRHPEEETGHTNPGQPEEWGLFGRH